MKHGTVFWSEFRGFIDWIKSLNSEILLKLKCIFVAEFFCELGYFLPLQVETITM